MARSAQGREHSLDTEEKDESAKKRFVGGEPLRVESFVGLLVGPLVIKPNLPDVGDDYPITGQVDRVLVALIDGRHSAAGVGAFEWVSRSLPFHHCNKLTLLAFTESPEGSVCELAVDFDVLLAGEGVLVVSPGWALVTEDSAEEVRNKIRKKFPFVQCVRSSRPEQASPFFEFRPRDFAPLR